MRHILKHTNRLKDLKKKKKSLVIGTYNCTFEKDSLTANKSKQIRSIRTEVLLEEDSKGSSSKHFYSAQCIAACSWYQRALQPLPSFPNHTFRYPE